MADAPRRLDGRDRLVAGLVVLAAEAVYLWTLAPTVTSEDSGELITAAYTMGVAHPPGFPLWCLLGKLFSCLPSGAPAWSLNFMSSLFGAATAGLLVLLGRSLHVGLLPSAAGALALAFSRHFWSQAVITEVYTLNTALLGGVILFLISWRATARAPHLCAASVLFGLGLANHLMLMLIASPALALYFLSHRRRLPSRPRTTAACVLLMLAGLSLYAYLPLAAAADPPLNWGDPSTWDRFVRHVSRAQYRSLELEGDVPWTTKLRFAGHFLGLLWEQFTPYVLIPFTLLGWGFLGSRNKERSLLLLPIILMNSAGLILTLHYSFDAENRTRMEEYYLPAYLCISVLVAAGLARLLRMTAGSRWRTPAVALCLLAPLLPLLAHWRVNDMSRYYLAYDFNRAVLESLPEGAVYIGSGDATVFPAVYLQACEGVRPDVILADVTGQLSPRAAALVREIDPGLDPADAERAKRALVLNGAAPVFVASKNVIRDRSGYRFDPWGLVYRVRSAGGPGNGTAPDIFSARVLRNLDEPTVVDYLGKGILADYHTMHGEALAEKGSREEALARYRIAMGYYSSSKEGLNNLGSTCAERAFADLAEEAFRQAAALDSGYRTPRANLARLLESRGRADEALRLWEEIQGIDPGDGLARARIEAIRADRSRRLELEERIRAALREIERDPLNPALHNNLGNMYAEIRDAGKALEAYRSAMRIDPGYALVYKNLGVLHRDLINDPVQAEVYFERYRMMTSLEGRGPRVP